VDPSRVMVGGQATELVNNLPGEDSVLLLNRGLFAVYVGGPYVDGAATGVPLAPLGSLAVPADRQWYGVADAAAKGAAQAVYRVPGGTAYSPAPSEIAAQIQASQLAAQIGAAVPSALAIAGAGYSTGSRGVDGPSRTHLTAAYPDNPAAIDISQAQSIDLLWTWKIGPARLAGTRAWGQLRLAWQDDTGATIQHDSFELCNTRPTVAGAASTVATIRSPAIGRFLQLSFESSQYGAAGLQRGAAALDFADLYLLQSARPTDRVRYFPGAVGNGATPGPGFTGILSSQPGIIGLAAGATSAPFVLEPYSGLIDLRYVSFGAPATVNIGFGSAADGNVTYQDGIGITSGVYNRTQLQGMRSQLFVTFKNTGTVATNVYVLAIAADS